MTRRLLTVAGCLAAAAGLIATFSQREKSPVQPSLSAFPLHIGTWRGQAAPAFAPRVLAALNVGDYLHRIYTDDDGYPLSLYIGYYGSQRYGATMHSPLNCLPGSGWSVVRKERVPLEIRADGQPPVSINLVTVQNGVDRQLVLYWYQSHRRITASEYWGKVYTVIDAVRLNRTDGGLVRIVLPILTSEEAVARRATAFARAIIPTLFSYFPDLLRQEPTS